MTIEQIRARLLALSGLMTDLSAKADITDADADTLDAHNKEFKSLSKKLKALEESQANLADAAQASTRQTAPMTPAGQNAFQKIEVGASATDRFGGFKSLGEFFMGVRQAGLGQGVPKEFQSAMYESNGEDGGWLIPETLQTEIIKKFNDPNESLLARTTQFKTSSNNLGIMVDEDTPWNQGVQGYWISEGELYTESKPRLHKASFQLAKLGALLRPTDELLEDAPALESLIMSAAPSALVTTLNKALINGDGVNKPQGILQSPFAVTVDPEASQTDDIVTANLIKMMARLAPNSLSNAMWLYDVGYTEKLMQLKDADGRYVFLTPGGMLNQKPFGSLLGLQSMPMMYGMAAPGDLGGIALVDWRYMYSLQKLSGGIKQATSIHAEFARDIRQFKFTMRVDARVPFKAPITSQNGYQVSGIVKLGAV